MHTHVRTRSYFPIVRVLFLPQVAGALAGLQARGSDPTFHAAVEAVCELVWCTVDPQTNQIDSNMMPLIQVGVASCVHV